MRNAALAAGFALGCWLVAAPVPVQAQESEKVFRLGSLSPAGNPVLDGAFTEALRRLGYVEGKNLIVEQRQADNQLERLPALAAELVDRKVDVILATGTLAPLVLKKVTTTIPVVIWSTGDPVGSGIVSSLARPGGNTTGLTIDPPDAKFQVVITVTTLLGASDTQTGEARLGSRLFSPAPAAGDTLGELFYVDRDVTVTGTATDSNGCTYDQHLKAGWNYVTNHFTSLEPIACEISAAQAMPAGIDWRYIFLGP